MTNQEIFYKGIDKLNLTDKQKLDVKILALEYAHQEYTKAAKLGHDRLMGLSDELCGECLEHAVFNEIEE
jgi:hypothetical protein